MKNVYVYTILLSVIFCQCNSTAKKASGDSNPKSTLSTELLETYWKLTELNGQPVNNPALNQKEVYIILKKEDHRLQGSGGCNTLMGTYELAEGNRLKFSGVASTRMACPDMIAEDGLKQALEITDNYAINGKFLMLHKAKMAPLAKFEAQ